MHYNPIPNNSIDLVYDRHLNKFLTSSFDQPRSNKANRIVKKTGVRSIKNEASRVDLLHLPLN